MTDGLPTDATFHDALVAGLRHGADYNQNVETPPVALLWTDPAHDWEPFIPALRDQEDLPIYTLGDWDPARQTGPAYWLRYTLDLLPCAADDDETGDEHKRVAGRPSVPIVYLPGYSRDQFHVANDCPNALRPLFALQFQGRFWDNRSHLDWTLPTALRDLAGARVQSGEKHLKALRQARPKLGDLALAELRAQAPLRDDYLLGLLISDRPRAMLRWLNDPVGERERLGDAGWSALVGVADNTYRVDLNRLSPVEVAARLAERQGEWATVWDRFTENVRDLPGVVAQLRAAHGVTAHQPGLFGGVEPPPVRKRGSRKPVGGAFPQDNEQAEDALRQELGRIAAFPASTARASILHLEGEHGLRRSWVWAKLGQTSLAEALEHLVTLAAAVETPPGGATVADITASYSAGGWRADDAMLRALAAVESAADLEAVGGAALALYRQWLTDGATALQTAWQAHPPSRPEPPVGLDALDGTCVLFADGLRFDLGQRLVAALVAAGLPAAIRPHLAAVPTVTPTAKNAVAPVAGLLTGGFGFDPTIGATGSKMTAPNLRSLLRDNGWQVLAGSATGEPEGGRAWTELGAIDSYGHESGPILARRVREEIDRLVARIRQLSEAGWRQVTVVTDHGWLLLPGGLPKNELGIHLTEARKGRCARIKPGAMTEQQVVPWHWDADVRIAVAPGICCFEAGHVYDHGGISSQESVIPVITVGAPPAAMIPPEIASIRWRGSRCRISVTGDWADVRAQLRLSAGDPDSAITAAVVVDEEGEGSMLAQDDALEGRRVWAVLLGPDGGVVGQRSTIVGTQ